MAFKDYLKEQKIVLQSAIASKMWPDNKDAAGYLNRKLRGKLEFTKDDEKLARKALKELGVKLISDAKQKP
jgi:ribulose 1,5-bisphosphate carboxylase large subunit-like protein